MRILKNMIIESLACNHLIVNLFLSIKCIVIFSIFHPNNPNKKFYHLFMGVYHIDIVLNKKKVPFLPKILKSKINRCWFYKIIMSHLPQLAIVLLKLSHLNHKQLMQVLFQKKKQKFIFLLVNLENIQLLHHNLVVG